MASASLHWPVRAYSPRHPAWPYAASDFARVDSSPDSDFYSTPRFVTHIDDNAISTLRKYYDQVLPRKGSILELCSSWISHLPPPLEEAATANATANTEKQHPDDASRVSPETSDQTAPTSAAGNGHDGLSVTGYGMNFDELKANPVLSRFVLRDFNVDPTLATHDRATVGPFDAAICVVSIDYLVKPREVLSSVLEALAPAATIHLVISNRCFPTKAVARWLDVQEEERLLMVGDYLWFAGYKNVEIVTLEEGKGASWFRSNDPLWVVRAEKQSSDGQ